MTYEEINLMVQNSQATIFHANNTQLYCSLKFQSFK